MSTEWRRIWSKLGTVNRNTNNYLCNIIFWKKYVLDGNTTGG